MTSSTQTRWGAGTPQRQGGRFRSHERGDAAVSLRPGGDEARASNPATSAKVLTRLSYSKEEQVREAVAGNPSTPVEDLRRMLNRGQGVRASVLGNPSLPEGDMLTVLRRPRPGDVEVIANNPAATAEVL